MAEQMMAKINEEIEIARRYYETSGKPDVLTNCKILGMIEMLKIVTGKEYTYDEDGLKERV